MDPARRRETVRLTGPLAVLSFLSIAGTVTAPALVARHPLLLVALCPRSVYVVAAVAHTHLAPLLAVGLVRLTMGDPLHFRLGRLHGAGMARRVERRFPVSRVGAPLVAASPTGKVLALAGAAGAPAARVVVADVLGTLVRLTALCGAGRAVAPWSTQLTERLAPAATVVPLVLVVAALAIAGQQLVRRWSPPLTIGEATCASW